MNILQLQGIGMTSRRTRDRLIGRLREAGIENPQVLDAIREVPRHLFVDEALAHRAYEDTALPIGYNQTISQPYIVARMTELLLAEGTPRRVLEVGTGSGYQTAVLALLVEQIYSVERIHPLQDRARTLLRELGFNHIQFKHADGGFGWPERGPYDGIICAAAPENVPQELTDQLAVGGRLVIPVGGACQELRVVTRRGESDLVTEVLEPVRFVPLLSGAIR